MTAARADISNREVEKSAPPETVVARLSAIDGHSPKPAGQPAGIAIAIRRRKEVLLHWLSVLCLALAAALILTRDQVGGRAMRLWLLEGHRHFGLLVLILLVVRVAVRRRRGKLLSASSSSWLIRRLAGLTHAALYASMLVLPLLGWSLSNAEGKPVHFLGASLPALVGADEDLADRLLVWHQDAAWLLLGLVSLHVAAALWHHFVVRDGVLRMMLPRRRH